jgi:hypothetical protein
MSSPVLALFIMSDLYTRPHDEDGSPVEFEALTVVVENERGGRFAHSHTFRGGELGREKARAEAIRLMARVQVAMAEGRFRPPEFNPHWNPIQPCYGSQAYAGEWRKWEARNELADENYEYNSEREWELREAASQ